MTTIFYLMIFLAFTMEFMALRQTKEMIAIKNRIKSGTWSELSSDDRAYSVMFFCYSIWAFIGLFSSQWPMFVLLFLLVLIPKKFVWWVKVDALISFLILLFILINKYHLHIDLMAFL